MAFGYAEAAMAACVHTAARMQYSNAEIHSLQLPSSEENSHSFPSLTYVTLWAEALLLAEDSRGFCRAMINWLYLALCFWTLHCKVLAFFCSLTN